MQLIKEDINRVLRTRTFVHYNASFYLAEGNLIEAFHVAQNHKAPGQLLKSLGKKLEKEYPLEAIWCYEKCVNEVIGRGSRYYSYAVKFIKNMRSIYEKSDNNTAFEKYILETKRKAQKASELIEEIKSVLLRQV